ncbi:hypothetical protein AAFF_G00183100 [Aldrovandia affinis]|uniref:Uncharacterized protein n=1 Tax=Aldrovandia affinis TaxID=143900 RepID=A0AAD7W6Z4_9TELE|nr:hypothetical protein AAFF_G00183100 [Aldrovandia affinis]
MTLRALPHAPERRSPFPHFISRRLDASARLSAHDASRAELPDFCFICRRYPDPTPRRSLCHRGFPRRVSQPPLRAAAGASGAALRTRGAPERSERACVAAHLTVILRSPDSPSEAAGGPTALLRYDTHRLSPGNALLLGKRSKHSRTACHLTCFSSTF